MPSGTEPCGKRVGGGAVETGGRRDLPPVNRFILDSLAANFGAVPPQPPAGLDWDQFLKGVVYHRVPFLLSALEKEGALPGDVRRRLRVVQRDAAIRTLTLTAATVQAVAACRAVGIRTLLLKGPAHSLLFFGRPDLRWSRDIDLLVRPGDRAAALRALAGLGFVAVGEEAEGTATLRRRQDGAVIELHGALAVDERLLPLSLFRPFDDAQEIVLGGCTIETMSPEKSLVYAAFHGTKHLWQQYFWLCDIAAARRCGTVDWPAALAIARAVGVDRHLLVTAALVEDYLGMPSPFDGAIGRGTAGRMRRLAWALHPVLADEDFDGHGTSFRWLGRMRYLWWDVCLQRRVSARWATLAWPWRPGERDRRFLRLPGPLGFLYPFVRLFRVVTEGFIRRRR